jgi:exodeoxyribonuclease-1
VVPVCDHAKKGGAVVYDLRHDPEPYLELTPAEIADRWRHFCKQRPCPHDRIPLKTMQFNRCPAIAPLGVWNNENQKRLGLTIDTIEQHHQLLRSQPGFAKRVHEAVDLLDEKQQASFLTDEQEVDSRLYDGFVGDHDKTNMAVVRAASVDELKTLDAKFEDDRLTALLPLYKARNYPASLSDDERAQWERFCERRLLGGKAESRAAKYFDRLAQLADQTDLNGERQYLLEELQLYGQSILPVID